MDIRDQKTVREWVCIVARGDQTDFEGETTTHTVDVTTVKMTLQSVLSMVGEKCVNLDLKKLYLATPMKE